MKLADETGRVKQDGSAHLIPILALDLLLLSVPLVFAAILLLGSLTLGRGLTQILTKSAIVFTIVIFMVAWIRRFFFPDLRDALKAWFSAWSHAAYRIASVVVAGSIERWRLGPLAGQFIYSFLVTFALALALLLAGVLLDGTGPGLAVKAVLLGQANDIKSITNLVLGSIYLSTTLLVVALAVSMFSAERWIGLGQRLRLQPWSPTIEEQSSIKSITVAHISDLHAQKSNIPLTESNHSHRPEALDELLQHVHAASPDAIVISGDLTDDGSIGAWEEFLKTPSLEVIKDRLVIAPGNHDLNLVEQSKTRSLFRIWSIRAIGRHLRAARFLQVANILMGNRALVVCPYTKKVSTLAAVMERAQHDLNKWLRRDPSIRRASLTPTDLLDACFPMAVYVEDKAGAKLPGCFIAWNSVKKNRAPIFNAIGEISAEQMKRVDQLISGLTGDVALVHVMHHQMALPSRSHLAFSKTNSTPSRLTEIGMVLENPAPLISWLARKAQRTILLHGHHHKYFVLKEDEAMTTIVSAPSATVGCEESYRKDLLSDAPAWLLLELGIRGPHAELQSIAPRVVSMGLTPSR